MNATLTKTRLQELIEEARAKVAASKAGLLTTHSASITSQSVEPPASSQKESSNLADPSRYGFNLRLPVQAVKSTIPGVFTWNAEQQRAIDLVSKGESCCIIGSAGTGKTTIEDAIVKMLIHKGGVPILQENTKYLRRGLPGILLTSFTRRAVRNIRKRMSREMQDHCLTVHKVLEYEPVFYEVWDAEENKMRSTMRFEPMRGPKNPLPDGLCTVIIDEAPMLDVDLHSKLVAALPPGTKIQMIYIGDLYQLPPVYGSGIMGFKLLELPVVELVQIYRQAADSPILNLAHRVKDGEDIVTGDKLTTIQTPQGKLTIHPWSKPIDDFSAQVKMSNFLHLLVSEGHFDEEEDVILCPQEKIKNRAFGTNEFNKVMAQALGDKRGAVVNEVIAGFQKHYFAIGDRLLVDREDGEILSITKNMKYFGKRTLQASKELDRWGNYKKKVEVVDDGSDPFDTDDYLDSFVLEDGKEKEDRQQQASHVITVKLLDSNKEVSISTAGEINASMFSYCLTVHKSQGSEWKRVFFITHQSHVQQWSRELLYTAITRAREELYMVVEPDRPRAKGTLWKAAKSPRIKGDTLAEKAEYFKGKVDNYKEREAKIIGENAGTVKPVRPKDAEEDRKPIVILPPPGSSVPLIKLEQLVSQAFKDEANKQLFKYWNQALGIWGSRIGNIPTISFDINKSGTIGLANLQGQHIRLNSLFCILSDSNAVVRKEMLEDTIIHEVCHLVAWNFSTDRGHESGWRMAMKLMGVKPEVYLNNPAFPEWAQGYKQLLEELKGKLEREQNADVKEDAANSQANQWEEV